MKIELDAVLQVLANAREESHKPVNDAVLLADAYDKMYNFGVDHMYFEIVCKLDEIVMNSKAVSA